MPERTRLRGWFLLLLAALALAALARASGLLLHRPLLAYANNYDQIRHSACLALAPWRPGVRPDRGHPEAPLSRYAFQPMPPGLCVTVLLPESSDPAHVAAALGLEPACTEYAGRSIYAMPLPVERVCTQVANWPRLEPWWLLLSDPRATARALLHIPRRLLPWIPPLGVVEGSIWGPLPSNQPSWHRVYGDRAGVAAGLLLLPWLVAAAAWWRRRDRVAAGFALTCAVGSAAVVLVSLFGDGDVDFAKHAQLAPNFALASLGLVFAALARRALDAGARR